MPIKHCKLHFISDVQWPFGILSFVFFPCIARFRFRVGGGCHGVDVMLVS